MNPLVIQSRPYSARGEVVVPERVLRTVGFGPNMEALTRECLLGFIDGGKRPDGLISR